MKTQGKVWVLFEMDTKSQSKPMSVVQTQMILLTLTPEAMKKVLIWTPGWDEWQMVSDYITSDQSYFAILQPPVPTIPVTDDCHTMTDACESAMTVIESPYTHVVMGGSPTKNEESGGYYFQDFNGDELDLKKINKAKYPTTKKKNQNTPQKENTQRRDAVIRQDPRFKFKIEVILVSKARSFRTYSSNISISGTMLEDEVPKDFLNQQFDLILVNPFEPDRTKSRLLFKAKIVGDLGDPRSLMFLEEDAQMTLRLNALLKAYVTYQEQIKISKGS